MTTSQDGIKVAMLTDIEKGSAIVIEPDIVDQIEPIAVFRTDDDELYALDDTCTHEEESLAEGEIEGLIVECPAHYSGFCLKTGKVQSLPATEDARTHKVEVRDDEVWLFPGTPAEQD